MLKGKLKNFKKVLVVTLSILIGMGCMQNVAEAAGKNGWVVQNNKWYYVQNSAKLSGWQVINGKWYYLGGVNDGAMKTGWQVINGKWYYLGGVNDGAMKTGWQIINGKWYYLGGVNDGAMKTGWQVINGRWYYLGGANDGAMKTDWQYIDGNWYYLGGAGDGAMRTGWQYVGGEWYYLTNSGAMASATWVGEYYVDASGKWIPGYTEEKEIMRVEMEHYIDVPVDAEKRSTTAQEDISKVETYLSGLKKWEGEVPEEIMGDEVYVITLTYEDGTTRTCSISVGNSIMKSDGEYYEIQIDEVEKLWDGLSK